MKNKAVNILMVLVVTLALGLSALTGSCKTASESTVNQPSKTVGRPTTAALAIIPFIPPSYYNCVQVDINFLCTQYFTHYGNLDAAEQMYDGLPFVFKMITVTANMILDANTLEISTCQFSAMYPGDVGKLQVGELIDVVGINSGPLPLIQGTPVASWFYPDGSPVEAIIPNGGLLFTGCIFLPSGAVALPAPGSPGFTSLY